MANGRNSRKRKSSTTKEKPGLVASSKSCKSCVTWDYTPTLTPNLSRNNAALFLRVLRYFYFWRTIMSFIQKVKRTAHQVVFSASIGLCSFAANASSTGLPWESPLERIVDSITGPVAFGASALGIVAGSVGLIFGGELDGFIRTIMMIGLVVAVIVGAINLLTMLFGVSGALVM
ncbi:TrbC/VirB2 family protein [Vibrio parahaemolyticus]